MTLDEFKYVPGEPASARKHNRLVDRVLQTKNGNPAALNAVSRVEALVKNDSGTDRDIGELLHIDDWLGPSTNQYEFGGQIIYSCVDLTWHTAIARTVIAAEPIPDGEFGIVVISGQCIVKAPKSSVSEQYSRETTDNLEFVMIDPGNLKQMLVTTGGIGKVLHRINDDFVAINFRHEQTKFRYKILESPSEADPDVGYSCELHDHEGNRIGGGAEQVIRMFDELNLDDENGIDYEGFCQLVGNRFYPAEGPCA